MGPEETIGSERLVLTPLRVEDADELAGVLDDPELHRFIGGRPDTLDELRARYAAMTAGPGRPDEEWRNWVVRRQDGQAVGTVQATLTRDGDRWTAAVAWVVGTAFQGRGYAAEAARALVGWLGGQGVDEVVAHIHPDHLASARVATRAGLEPTADQVDGEQVWRLPGPPTGPARLGDRLAAARRRLVVGRSAEPALAWLDRMAERELAANPLLRSRLAVQAAGGAPTPATLARLLRETAAELRAGPRGERPYQALACTYFEPAATQELAAERLGLPFSTYRYRLAGGVRQVTARLWQRELHGPDA